jgi:cyclin H
MTYDALIISRTITFIACKTDNHTLTLDEYVSKLGHGTRDEILAPEHLIVQALRFNFEVRHPFRGLKGVFLELGEMAKGTTPGWTPMPWDSRSKADIQTAMLQVPRMMEDDERGGTMMSEKEVQKRLDHSYSHAAHILKTTAQLTDAYFLYTPSQLLHAALLLADEPLLLFYLSTKLLPSSRIYKKSLMVIRSCSVLFASHRSFTATSSSIPAEEKAAQKEQANAEVKLLMKKLKQCRDPDKIDLVKLNQAQKRDAVSGGGALDENKAKRRKIAREGAEKESDEFWGPEIKKS